MSNKPRGDQYVGPPRWYDGRNKWMNCSGVRIMVGPGRSPFYLNEISHRTTVRQPATMMVSGPPGSGKSYWALRRAQMLDPNFDVTLQVAMDRKHLLELIGPDTPLKRGSVIVLDEAQFLLSSRRWFEELQKHLVEQIESIRSQGLILIIVALHIELMDVIVRKHVLNYFVYLEKPGDAVVYRLFTDRFDRTQKYYRLGRTLQLLPGDEDCNDPGCLVCKHSGLHKNIWRRRDKWEKIGFVPCCNMRAIYERMKRHKLDMINIESLEKLKAKEKAMGDTEMLQIMFDNHNLFVRLKNGKLDPDSISYELEKITGEQVPRVRAYSLRNKFGYEHPTLDTIKEVTE